MKQTSENQTLKYNIDRWAAFGVFAALFFLYWRTLCPTVGVGDSGELVTAAYTLGIPHPTGFPLYILLGKLFIIIFPFGEVAFRMNLFSALAAAGTGAVFYRWMRLLENPHKIAFSGALILGCSLSFWSQATIARVYSLNALLSCICLYYGFLPDQNFRTRAWFFFWWGMALANHTLSIIVGILFLVLWFTKRDFPLKEIWASIFMLPGLSLYLYLPLRSRMNPSLDIGNPETWEALWAYLARTMYWENRYVENLPDVLEVVWHYLAILPDEFTWLGAALILAGIYYLVAKKEYAILFVTVGLFVINVFLVASHGSFMDIFHWSRYIIPGYIGITLIICYGLRFCSEQYITCFATGSWQSAILHKLLGMGLPVLLPLLLLWSNFIHNNRSRDWLAYDYSYIALSSVPENAAIFPMWDNTAYTMLYLQKVLGIRPDVKLHMSYYQQDKWIKFDRSQDIFFTEIFFDIPQDTVLRPDGLLFRLMKPQDPPPRIGNWEKWKLRGIDDQNLIKRDFLTRYLASKYWSFMSLAVAPLNKHDAEKLIHHSLDLSHDNDRFRMWIAFYYYLQGNFKQAEKQLLTALKTNAKNKTASTMLKNLREEILTRKSP